MMKYLNTIVVVFVVVAASAGAVDYCSKPYCKGHIACNNTGDFGPSCPADRSVIPMTVDVIALILKKHNTVRMDIANAKYSNFTSANRMIEMSWDNELASMAEMTAKTCLFAHDKCINTATFQYAGQNMAKTSSSTNATTAVNQLFQLWYEEYTLCNMTYINEITGGGGFGHFTQIIMANSSKIGCAIVKYAYTWLFVCDYSQTNVISWPVYTVGAPCSGCTSGCSTTYPGLCDVSEVV